jgi:cobyrinic acid a,c-diamide synthase
MQIVIGGASSGVGKTTITTGLIATLRQRGLSVQPFKVGPDYIDPSYLSLAAGRPCYNLDTWLVSPEQMKALYHHNAGPADIAVIEGVMGLFDGQNYADDSGSTAQVAKLLNAPVVLVIDASNSARSAAAVALGFQHFDPHLKLAGFLINDVSGASHGEGVAQAVKQATGLPVLGWLPRDPALSVPERHLGLVPTLEPGPWLEWIAAARRHVEKYIDIDQLIETARGAEEVNETDNPAPQEKAALGTRPVIAVARDEAFNFIYPENLDLLRAAGAQIAFFSPLCDDHLPQGAAGIVLSGGFPEMVAEKMAQNAGLREELRSAFNSGKPIYAECGGLMALTQSIVDLQGREHRAFGLLPGRAMMSRQLTLGYRSAQAACDSWLMRAGEIVHAHEFHNSVWEGRPDDLHAAYTLADGKPEGAAVGSLWASYLHLSFWSRPELAKRFTACCSEI